MTNLNGRAKIIFLLVVGVVLVAAAFAFRFPASAGAIYRITDKGEWLLPLVVIASLVDSINPCAFSVLLLTIAFLFSLGRLRSDILKIGGAYILGIFLVYMLIGLGILQVLHLFGVPHFMAKLAAGLLIVLGMINLLNEFFPAFPIKLKIPQASHGKIAELMHKASLPTAFLLGSLVGLCEFPCTGGPYLMILGLLHDRATYLRGFGYLILYNLIFVLPLAVILGIASDRALLEKVRNWQKSEVRSMRLGGGIAMIILGIIIFLL
jgi:cytochrome c-type biogenesis protein